MAKVAYYTKEGLQKLKDELNQLKDIERPKASQAIADARDKVISSNSACSPQSEHISVSHSGNAPQQLLSLITIYYL